MIVHSTHKTRFSDASTFDEICTLCGATDTAGSYLLAEPCPGKDKAMNELEKLFKGVGDWMKETFEVPKPTQTQETDVGPNKKKIVVELPEKPAAGGFSGGPSGDNEYDEACDAWRKEVNRVIVDAIPKGYALESSKVKEEKIVRTYAEIVVEKS